MQAGPPPPFAWRSLDIFMAPRLWPCHLAARPPPAVFECSESINLNVTPYEADFEAGGWPQGVIFTRNTLRSLMGLLRLESRLLAAITLCGPERSCNVRTDEQSAQRDDYEKVSLLR